MSNGFWLLVYGIAVGAVIIIVELNQVTLQTEIEFLQNEAIELGYGKKCVGNVFVWIDQSCEMDK